MFYWLFTEGRALLGGLIAPLLCLSLFLPLVIALLLGAGIHRTGDIPQMKGKRRLYLLTIHIVLNLTATAIYLSILGGWGIARQVGRQTSNRLILLLNGAPPSINQMRLFMTGIMLVMLWFMLSIAVHPACLLAACQALPLPTEHERHYPSLLHRRCVHADEAVRRAEVGQAPDHQETKYHHRHGVDHLDDVLQSHQLEI